MFQHLQLTLSRVALITSIHRCACELSIVHARYMYVYSQGGHDPLGSHCHHHVHQLLRVLPKQGNNCLLCAVGEGAAATTPAMALHQLLHHWSTAETDITLNSLHDNRYIKFQTQFHLLFVSYKYYALKTHQLVKNPHIPCPCYN